MAGAAETRVWPPQRVFCDTSCDAISFVVVTTLLDRMPCFAFDEDFRRLGLTVITAPH